MTMLYSKITLFAKDAKGAVLPTVAAVLVGLMGMATLALDISRYMDLQTQLQKAADSFALAAAAELDGQPAIGGAGGAIARANNAVTALMASRNSSVFNAAAVTAAVAFYPTLPATDNLAMGGATADPTQAHFVQVVVNPVTTSTFIPATLFGAASNNMTTSATAVAGFTQAICRQTPIFVCNGGGANDMTNAKVMRGKEFSLVGAPGAGFSPGNYGFVDIGCGNNTPCLEQALGKNNNGICIGLDPVTTTTGQKTAAGRYFDTRFDLYVKNAKNADPTVYSPDANVRKGYTPGCNTASAGGWGPPAVGTELPFPDDSNVAPPYSTATIGNGNWQGNFNNYWAVNFPGVARPAAPATRFDLYQYENANGLVPKKACGTACGAPNGEVGTPQCHPETAQTCDPINNPGNCRRFLYAAVVDCSKLGGGQTKVTPEAIVQFFLLQPLIQTAGGFGTMLAEYVDVAKPNDASGVLHDIVQLYR